MNVTFLSGVVRNRKLVQVSTSLLSSSPTNSSQNVTTTPFNQAGPGHANTSHGQGPNTSISNNNPSSGAFRNSMVTQIYPDQFINDHTTTSNINTNSDYDPNFNIFNFHNNVYISIYFSLAQFFSAPFSICGSITRNFKLRVHKFTFQWDLVRHFVLSIGSLLPFIFTGERLWVYVICWSYCVIFESFHIKCRDGGQFMAWQPLMRQSLRIIIINFIDYSITSYDEIVVSWYLWMKFMLSCHVSWIECFDWYVCVLLRYAICPLIIWGFYNILFLIGVKKANSLIPGFSKLRHTFQASIEEFFSPKLLPIISISFLLVALSLAGNLDHSNCFYSRILTFFSKFLIPILRWHHFEQCFPHCVCYWKLKYLTCLL